MSKIVGIIQSAALFVAVFLFWAFAHPEALSYHEQYQMFLFSWDYLFEHLRVAGGMAEYVAEFFVQFNYYPVVGAALMASLFLGLQIGTWRMAKALGADGCHYGLSLVPAVLMLVLMGDDNVKAALLVAVVVTVFAAVAYARVDDVRWRCAAQVVAVPVVYLLCGVAVVVYVVLCAIAEARRGRWAVGVGGVAYAVVIVAIAAWTWMSQYATQGILIGHNYYNLRMASPAMLFVVVASAILVPLAMAFLPRVGRKWISVAECIAVFAIGAFAVTNSFDTKRYELVNIDRLVRGEKWAEVVTQAEACQPSDPTGLSAVNLSLAMRGELLDKMFSFSQIGPHGLLTRSLRDQFTSFPTAEAFFRLGMVNMAQYYFFDLQEGIIDCRKSGRISKRIAETLIVNGRYEMARKYICRLKETLFYSQWARMAETYLGNDAAVDAHPVWGRLRKLRFKSSFFANYYEMDKMLAILYDGNHDNRMALDYFLAQCLLRRDIRQLWTGLGWAREAYGSRIPRHVQEAVIVAWSQSHPNLDGVPIPISPDVTRDFTEFVKMYAANRSDIRLNAPRWRKTYWHYLLLQQPQEDTRTGATIINNEEQVR